MIFLLGGGFIMIFKKNYFGSQIGSHPISQKNKTLIVNDIESFFVVPPVLTGRLLFLRKYLLF